MSTRAHLRTVLRDLASFTVGCAIILKQAGIFFAPPPQPSELLIIVAAAIIGVPGAAQLFTARTGSAPTAGQSSSSASPASPPSPSGESRPGGN